MGNAASEAPCTCTGADMCSSLDTLMCVHVHVAHHSHVHVCPCVHSWSFVCARSAMDLDASERTMHTSPLPSPALSRRSHSDSHSHTCQHAARTPAHTCTHTWTATWTWTWTHGGTHRHTDTHTETETETETDKRTDTPSHHTHALPHLARYGSHQHYLYAKLVALTLYTAILASCLTAQQYRTYKLVSFVCITPGVKYMSLYADARTNTRQMRQFIYTTVTDSIMAVCFLYIIPRAWQGAWYGLGSVIVVLMYMAIEYGNNTHTA